MSFIGGAGSSSHSLIVDEQSHDRMLTRIAHEIVENNDAVNALLVGIVRRGEVLRLLLPGKVLSFTGFKPKLAHLISVYRDDFEKKCRTGSHAANYRFDITRVQALLAGRRYSSDRISRAAPGKLIIYEDKPERVQLAVVDRVIVRLLSLTMWERMFLHQRAGSSQLKY